MAVGPDRPVAPIGVKVNVEKLYKTVDVFVTTKLEVEAEPPPPVAVTIYEVEKEGLLLHV
jgi:hypothetical protein